MFTAIALFQIFPSRQIDIQVKSVVSIIWAWHDREHHLLSVRSYAEKNYSGSSRMDDL